MRTNKTVERIGQPTRMPVVSWKSAFGMVFGAASRLHHYRDVRTHMLHVAMRELDCGAKRDECDDE